MTLSHGILWIGSVLTGNGRKVGEVEMTKQEILDRFNDIDFVYNDSSKHETLSRMLDELLKDQQQQIWELQDQVEYITDKLKEQEPVPSEMEGGGYNWYPVCGACHGVIGDMDSYCKHCGTPVLKKEIKTHHMRGGVEIEETE